MNGFDAVRALYKQRIKLKQSLRDGANVYEACLYGENIINYHKALDDLWPKIERFVLAAQMLEEANERWATTLAFGDDQSDEADRALEEYQIAKAQLLAP